MRARASRGVAHSGHKFLGGCPCGSRRGCFRYGEGRGSGNPVTQPLLWPGSSSYKTSFDEIGLCCVPQITSPCGPGPSTSPDAPSGPASVPRESIRFAVRRPSSGGQAPTLRSTTLGTVRPPERSCRPGQHAGRRSTRNSPSLKPVKAARSTIMRYGGPMASAMA